METLKDFFEKNKDEFNNVELPEGHEKRFLKKLEKPGKSIGLKVWYAVAASFIFLAMLSFFGRDFIYKQQISNNIKSIRLGDISPKYQEVEAFYLAGIESKINEFENLNCRINDEQKLMIDNELEKLDVNYKLLQNELLHNNKDERIINAMIDNYQNKINFLDLVINQIKLNC